MINPLESAKRLILNDPDRAVDLFDIMLKATEPGFKDSNEYDEVMQFCWLNSQAGRDAREAYAKGRLQRTDLQPVDRVPCAGAGSN